jgi:ABC-2 type transport system ATP-binding protein
LAIMDHGKVLTTGSPLELVQQLELPSVVEFAFDGDAPDAAGFASKLGQTVECRGDLWEIPTQDPKGLLPCLLEFAEMEKVPYQQVHVRRATLEDVFLHRTGRSLRE